MDGWKVDWKKGNCEEERRNGEERKEERKVEITEGRMGGRKVELRKVDRK